MTLLLVLLLVVVLVTTADADSLRRQLPVHVSLNNNYYGANSESSSRIVGGRDVSSWRDFPWFGDWHKGCGGTLVMPDVVLTAAHCEEEDIHSPWSFGSLQPDDLDAEWTVGSESYEIHPDYYPGLGNMYDVMLVKLEESADTDDFPPIQLNTNPAFPLDGEELTVIGHGTTNEVRQSSNHLQQVQVDYVDNCKDQQYVYQWYDYIFPGKDEPHLCAGVEDGGQDSCFGDSGGPLFYEAPNGDFVQVGIVSWGDGCARAEAPGVYARISKAVDWIHERMCAMSDEDDSVCRRYTQSSEEPTQAPSEEPTPAPVKTHSSTSFSISVPQNLLPQPTDPPTPSPTVPPTPSPTAAPTPSPTAAPTDSPTTTPETDAPTDPPTAQPTKAPTQAPTPVPTTPPTPQPTLNTDTSGQITVHHTNNGNANGNANAALDSTTSTAADGDSQMEPISAAGMNGAAAASPLQSTTADNNGGQPNGNGNGNANGNSNGNANTQTGAIRVEITTDDFPQEVSFELYWNAPPSPTPTDETEPGEGGSGQDDTDAGLRTGEEEDTAEVVVPETRFIDGIDPGFLQTGQTTYAFNYQGDSIDLQGTYHLVIKDAGADGMCCAFGIGKIKVFQEATTPGSSKEELLQNCVAIYGGEKELVFGLDQDFEEDQL